MKTLIMALLLTLSSSLLSGLISNFASANVSLSGVSIPQKIVIEKTTLELNGTTYRKVSLFNVKVWLSALYLETLTTDSDSAINSKTMKVIDLHALYDISASDSVKGWKMAIENNCEFKCQTLEPEIKKFYSSVPDFKKNSHYRYIFTATGLQILLDDNEIFKSTQPEFATLLLKTWIGNKPPSEDIKKDLLRGPVKL